MKSWLTNWMNICLISGLVLSPVAAAESQTAIFSGGCFWGVDAVFKHVKGVVTVTSGYAGGSAATATYVLVSRGNSGHAEAVEVVFDPAQVSYRQLLEVFFKVAHDPTQLNRQGPDIGTQYRSAIFFLNAEQQQQASAYIRDLASAFGDDIVTRLVPLEKFYAAEPYHQNYLALHPDQPYIVVHDQPKLLRLRTQFPDLFQ